MACIQMCPKAGHYKLKEHKIMLSQSNLSDRKISVNTDNLDWIAVISLVVLIFSLMSLLFLNYEQFVKDIDLAIMTVSLIVMLITLPIHGREDRIAKLLSLLKKM